MNDNGGGDAFLPGGYQGPPGVRRHVAYTLGEAERTAGPLGPWGSTITLYPMVGGREDTFSLCVEWDIAERHELQQTVLYSRGAADWLFRRRAEALEEGEFPWEIERVAPAPSDPV